MIFIVGFIMFLIGYMAGYGLLRSDVVNGKPIVAQGKIYTCAQSGGYQPIGNSNPSNPSNPPRKP